MTIVDALANLRRLKTNREETETEAATSPAGDVIQGVVTGVDTSGRPILRTNSGGQLTVDSQIQLGAGETTQISVSAGGTAQINQGAATSPVAQAVANGFRILFRLAAPVIGTNFGQAGAMWLHEVSTELVNGYVKGILYIWSPNNGYVQIGGPQSETNGYIEVPTAANVYPIISRATFSSRITSMSITVNGVTATTTTLNDTSVTVSGTTTVTLSSAIGSIVGVDGALTLTVTATSENPIAFTIGYV